MDNRLTHYRTLDHISWSLSTSGSVSRSPCASCPPCVSRSFTSAFEFLGVFCLLLQVAFSVCVCVSLSLSISLLFSLSFSLSRALFSTSSNPVNAKELGFVGGKVRYTGGSGANWLKVSSARRTRHAAHSLTHLNASVSSKIPCPYGPSAGDEGFRKNVEFFKVRSDSLSSLYTFSFRL